MILVLDLLLLPLSIAVLMVLVENLSSLLIVALAVFIVRIVIVGNSG